MKKETPAPEWQRLLRLLAPVHDGARATARRLAADPSSGDDLFQDALLRALDKLSTLRDETRFRSWFYAVLLSVHRSRSRRAFWRRCLSLDGEREKGWEPIGEDGGDFAEETWRAGRMARALDTLPAVQREAIVLFELQDFSIEEIADMQNATISAVKSRLARGRDRLRRHYERLGFRPASGESNRRAGEAPGWTEGANTDPPRSGWLGSVGLSLQEDRHE